LFTFKPAQIKINKCAFNDGREKVSLQAMSAAGTRDGQLETGTGPPRASCFISLDEVNKIATPPFS